MSFLLLVYDRAMLFGTFATVLLTAFAAGTDVVVVCPPAFEPELAPWLAFRESQGHVIEIIPPGDSVEQTRERIRRVAERGALRFVVLVGDTRSVGIHPAERSDLLVPTDYVEATVNVDWGSPSHIATDNSYADLDGDRVPDVAVGRLSVDTSEELRRIVAKIVRYENSTDFGPWRRQVNFVAGVGDFGVVADTVLERAARYLLTSQIPVSYAITMTHAGWRSPFFPDPRRFRETTMERLNEGPLFWVYMGHGFYRHLGGLQLEEESFPVLANEDIPHLNCKNGPPVAVFLACYVGAFDAPEDCLAEHMLRAEGGPVAVIAGSRVTMPYAMAVLGQGMLTEVFVRRRATLGEILLNAKREMVAREAEEDPRRRLIDAVASIISPTRDRLREEREEHLELFNLLGDPLLRVRHPDLVEIASRTEVTAGETLTVSGVSPISGTAVLELVAGRERLTFPFVSRTSMPCTDEEFAGMQEVYQRANNRCVLRHTFPIEAGPFERTITVPEEAIGGCYARVFIQGDSGYATGGNEIRVSQAPSGTRRF